MDDSEIREQFSQLKAIASRAVSKAEIAASRAEGAEIALMDLKRLEPDENGLPGFLPHITSQLVALRAEVRPITAARTYALHVGVSAAVALFVTLVAGSCH